jgi:glycerol-3-phosphate acyltransferase PlsY
MEQTFITHVLAGTGGYLLGSIPVGIVLARVFGLGDLRKVGSGNIGATNVLRTGNKLAAALTLLFDAAKGAIAVGVTHLLTDEPNAMLAAGFWSVMGHNFPVWLKFEGGKGVSTTLGVMLATAWPVGLAGFATWLTVAAIFRYSSLSAIVALAAAPLYAWFFTDWQHTVLAGLLAIVVIARHHENIRRLLNGTESKIGQKKNVPQKNA